MQNSYQVLIMGVNETVRLKKKKKKNSLNGLIELPITPFLSTSEEMQKKFRSS